MKKITFSLFIALLITAVSCKKDDDNNGGSNPGPQLTKKQMLTAKPWKATGFTLGGSDAWSAVDNCSKDDIFTFKADGTYVFNEGASKCDPSDPQEETDTWVFADNETKLTYDGDTYVIKELTSSKMVLEVDFFGTPATTTFAAQ